MPNRGRRRLRRYQPVGLKHCATCGAGIGRLQQHTRWAAGFCLTVCPTCNRMTSDELGRTFQQLLSVDTPSAGDPPEVG